MMFVSDKQQVKLLNMCDVIFRSLLNNQRRKISQTDAIIFHRKLEFQISSFFPLFLFDLNHERAENILVYFLSQTSGKLAALN
jgi:hypothetical protein